MSSKITVIIHAGLGNQLFMIFTCISKALDENKDFSIYPIYNNQHRSYYFTSLLKELIFKVETNITEVQKGIGYEEKAFNYNPIPKDVQLLMGYFQSPKYFDHNKEKIINITGLNKFMDKYKFTDKTITIHLRFGDSSYNQCNHTILKPSYYIKSLNKLLDLVPNAINEYKFMIFAEKNDDELVNDYIDDLTIAFDNKINFYKFNDIYPNLRDYQELMYMSSSDHFIIGSSTYSWFAAYLSKNNNKKVIYPEEWFGPNSNDKSTKDLFPDDWIKIKS